MFRCCECGEVFNEDNADYRQDYVGDFWGVPAYDQLMVCPSCGADEIEDFDPPYSECEGHSGCDFDCENCKLAEEKEKDNEV